MADKAVLTDKLCKRAEEIAEEISSYPTKIRVCNETFSYVSNYPSVQEWLGDTEVGIDLKKRLENNIKSLENMSNSLITLVSYTNQLVARSRAANQKK